MKATGYKSDDDVLSVDIEETGIVIRNHGYVEGYDEIKIPYEYLSDLFEMLDEVAKNITQETQH